ncbi:hypothetical protein GCM10027034_41440 [Ramlibacter solisilvae]|nr:GYF domain-containing protein [Ramlibacter tataouinensis]
MHRYHLSRNGKVLGIYPEDRMKEYFDEGRVGPNDLVWREGLDSWQPAWQVFGGEDPQAAAAPPPLPPEPERAPAIQAPAEGLPALQPAIPSAVQPDTAVPPPPRLHWALVLLLSFVTFGLFFVIWMFVQARWVRRIDPASDAIPLTLVYLALVIAGQWMGAGTAEDSASAATGALLVLAGWIVSFFAFFSMRRSMLDHYNRREPIGLRLSAFMTFVFNVFYFQHHMTRIARWKATGVLSP